MNSNVHVRARMRTMLLALALTSTSVLVIAAAPSASALTCLGWTGNTTPGWNNTPSLNSALATAGYDCVTVSPGTYSFSSQILVKPGRTLQANVRGQVVLRANPGFSNEILVTEPLGANAQVTVRRLVLDGASNVNGVIGAAEMIISDNEIRGAKCWGAAVAGVSVVISGNLIKNNGASCATAPPGTGIYVTANPGPTPNTWAPLISSNEIAYNTGPGIDINNG
jgi:hypothetical protein